MNARLWFTDRPVIAWGLLTLITAAILAFGSLRLYSVILRSSRYERYLRSAQLARSRTMRLQLDEQSALRGFLLAHDGAAMARYAEAASQMPVAESALSKILQDSALLAGRRFALDERNTNRTWQRVVAGPCLIAPTNACIRRASYSGELIDRFRQDDAAIDDALGNAERRADAASRADARAVLWFTVGAASLAFALVIVSAFLQRRAVLEMILQKTAYVEERRTSAALQNIITREALRKAKGLELDAIFQPAEGYVGGDWYDVLSLAEGWFFFSVGDVMGHGLEAATAMIGIRDFLIAFASQTSDPGDVLKRANGALALQYPHVVATAVCGFITPDRNSVRYSAAGHPPPLFVSASQSNFGAFGGPPLGVSASQLYESHIRPFAQHDAVLLYTDGLVEIDRDIIAASDRLAAIGSSALGRGWARLAHRIVERMLTGKRPTDDIAALTIVRVR
ncbi:MAG TPA: PP2C family protein-serine/threonine phosphatase [Candidatus Baltobacteraceae bacterium]|nr:PP2C family protein-serine/threonine phosphatase [Candidatus Baltobacteraceae bacterium]